MKAYKSKLPYKTYVRHLVANLKSYLFLDDWQLTLEYAESAPPERKDALACVYSEPRYLNATIEVFPSLEEQYKEYPTEETVETLLHEMLHIVTETVHLFARSAVTPQTEEHLTTATEQQTQRLTRIIMKSLPKSVYQL